MGKRIIIIDSKSREVREAEIPEGPSLSHLQQAVDGLIELVRVEPGVDLFVDEEGLLKNPQDFFWWKDCAQPFAGNGVMIGADESTGESATLPPAWTVERVKSLVTFHSAAEVVAKLHADGIE